jgi:hypothetical protein
MFVSPARIRPARRALARLLLLLTATTVGAEASVLSVDTRHSSQAALSDAAAYRAYIDALVAGTPTAGYGDAPLSAYDGVSNRGVIPNGASGDIAFAFTVDFGVAAAQAGNWSFRIGTDFGRGGAVFLDGAAMALNTADMWWGGNWSNTGQIFAFSVALGAGNHRMTVYGLEDCCDGPQSGQFLAAGAQGFTNFAITDGLVPNAIAEPGSLLLSGTALAGLILVQRRSRQRPGQRTSG